MRKIATVFAVLWTAAACSGAPPVATPTATVPPSTAPPTPAGTPPAAVTPQPTPCPRCFDVSRALAHARTLAVDIGRREAGTAADRRAAEYLASTLGSLGYAASLRTFPLPQGGESWNVVAFPPGSGRGDAVTPPWLRGDGRYLIVGGHYDSLRGPGANDNATGVGATLEIARLIAADPAPFPVVVILFGAEERQPGPPGTHHIGSRHYVDNMSEEERAGLVAMINVDMIGRGVDVVCGRIKLAPLEATQRLLRVAREIGVPARERVTPDWSDHGSFQREGMNAGWIWTGEDPAYHSPRDTFERLDPASVERGGRLGLAVLRSYSP